MGFWLVWLSLKMWRNDMVNVNVRVMLKFSYIESIEVVNFFDYRINNIKG